ncbi:hypothetical protein GWI33_004402 [Rhynchophorus ferrugineus]|uniref:Uncharacterized protein n=1 Tax=Rhynchophorus ferrugineus TaxID=354439 RepID=A0A834IPH9_RHYFE|nr:hypothetical protein GWI33_004402 [Rhynchophorus ferrugineus]
MYVCLPPLSTGGAQFARLNLFSHAKTTIRGAHLRTPPVSDRRPGRVGSSSSHTTNDIRCILNFCFGNAGAMHNNTDEI